jgi:photosystem II stability/assembly factor-like uncharacterized protein
LATPATKRQSRKKSKGRPVQAPKRRDTREGRSWWPWAVAVAAAVAIVGIATVVRTQQGGDVGEVAAGLPDTPDYHSLLVAPDDAQRLVLGTHAGLFASSDGGRSWKRSTLSGQDAMNLAPAGEGVVWAGGHDVLAKSADGGLTWESASPSGLPGRDVHGFAVDPRDPRTLYAAIAGQGLFRSKDGGASFSLVSRQVGPGVMALAVTPDGRILAGDMQQGLLVSSDSGQTWKLMLEASLMGLAVNPANPQRIVATGPGILGSDDGGRTWSQAMPLEQGAGPVAWATSDPDIGYVVGFDQTLYRTDDGGQTWQPVG